MRRELPFDGSNQSSHGDISVNDDYNLINDDYNLIDDDYN